MNTLLKAEDLSLRKFFSLTNDRFRIPYTQRPYEWNKAQVERLFNDVIGVYEGQKDNHILNFFTLFRDGEYQNIYDGQQRTVTLLIILCSIVNKIDSLGEGKRAEKIREEFIRKESWHASSEDIVKITFDKVHTNEFFKRFIIDAEEMDINFDITDDEKSLKKNHEIINTLLTSYIDKNELNADDLADLVNKMIENMYVIVLETRDEEVANQMFETLNNTGKKLANFYVLKNNCVKIIGEEQTAEYWNEIEANTDSLNKKDFLVYYTSLKNGKTTENNAINALEKHQSFSSPENVRNLLEEMKLVSRYFLELHEPSHRQFSGNQTERKVYTNLIVALNDFLAKQYRPLILAMKFKKYPNKDINDVLKQCLNLQIRNFFIAKHKANTVEVFYPDLAKKVYSNDANITNEIISQINEKLISDDKVRVLFRDREIASNDNKRVRYILRQIYDYENAEELMVNTDAYYVNLEHILPQNPKEDSDWNKCFTKEEVVKYTNHLGNLTLVLSKTNSALGNKEFADKRISLQESNIKHNQEIAQNDKWTAREIEVRYDSLIESFIKVF